MSLYIQKDKHGFAKFEGEKYYVADFLHRIDNSYMTTIARDEYGVYVAYASKKVYVDEKTGKEISDPRPDICEGGWEYVNGDKNHLRCYNSKGDLVDSMNSEYARLRGIDMDDYRCHVK